MTVASDDSGAEPQHPGDPDAAGSGTGSTSGTGSAADARFRRWLLSGMRQTGALRQGPHAEPPERTRPWWQVMCLTGVDYFSTLGYQPAIAALAAGTLAPMATLILVLLTLFGALPVYRWVAGVSTKGEGSIAMLERLLPWWGGKILVLVLLGFVATDFIITITLSSADATAHIIENPFTPTWFRGLEVPITLILIAALAVVFLRGFKEAIGIAVVLVAAYLALNAVVVVVAFTHIAETPTVVTDWWTVLTTSHGSPFAMIAIALLVFPKLALGLSGFETGVAVMPQVRGAEDDTPQNPRGRIRGTRRLLTTAAIIMSCFLITSSFATTLLIPAHEFEEGGLAYGRALAYLAHLYLGDVFGTVYDVSTIAILWFAGASAMAGLLNIVPRYLPRYGMAPQWTTAVRPLVIVFTVVAVLITLAFEADVEAQGGAYATGVLVLITSAAFAVTLSAKKRRRRGYTLLFAVITVVFLYTTIVNIVERPDGVRIASLFILGIVVVSLASRVQRSFQLRATSVRFDAQALDWLDNDAEQQDRILIVAHEPKRSGIRRDGPPKRQIDDADLESKLAEERRVAGLPHGRTVLFLEVLPSDSSDFEEDLVVTSEVRKGYRVLTVTSGNVPNTIAAVLLQMREHTGLVPDVYFGWTEGNPLSNMFRFLITGTGEVAPVTREVLRRAEPNPKRRPGVHVA